MRQDYDVVIVGTGVAGLFCALHLPRTCRVLLITKGKLEESDSFLAQGGIAMLKDPSDYDAYFEDTMKAGHYTNHAAAVRTMILDSPEIIQELIGFGVSFDRKEDGSFDYAREGAHSTHRILHHFDMTGREITQSLLEQVKRCENICWKEELTMLDLIVTGAECNGMIVWDGTKADSIWSKVVVLATGGIGGIFQNSTNYAHLTGDSLAIAMKHHIAIDGISNIQIHPTTLYSSEKGRRFLISESVRGAGAILLNQKKERFVDELLPRDVVTNAIEQQLKHTGGSYVYLSMQGFTEKMLQNHFVHIVQTCAERGIDVRKDLIPVVPSQHYFMGGIQVDLEGQTSMQHLYAIGEISCTGVHGRNRLASNSLLEGLVFAKRAARKIAEQLVQMRKPKSYVLPLPGVEEVRLWQQQVQQVIWKEIQKEDPVFYEKWGKHSAISNG